MQLCESTRKILENFATINNNIIINASTTESDTLLQICDRHKQIIAQTRIPEKFENQVCINDLKQFLSTVTALKNPNIEFGDNQLTMTGETATVRIVYGDPSNVLQIKKTIELPETSLEFLLKQDTLEKLLNLSSILSLPNLRLFSKDGKLFFQVLDKKNPSSNTAAIEVGTGEMDKDVFFDREFLKMIPGDYLVKISSKASEFKNTAHNNLSYIIALAI